VDGDVLIIDSVRIYGANATWNLIFGPLSSKNVLLIWLPKYSPEFNPMELYWRHFKGEIRNLPSSDDFVNIKESVLDITASISSTSFILKELIVKIQILLN
jgi:transposase